MPSRGFTLIELVTVMVVLGILAVVALPRMDSSAYYAMDFHDRTVAALRYAQKTATSHRRQVCVTFPDNATVKFQIAGAYGGTCGTGGTDLMLPGTSSNLVVSKSAKNAYFISVPTSWSFTSDGTTGADYSISIYGAASAIVVSGATGYVQ